MAPEEPVATVGEPRGVLLRPDFRVAAGCPVPCPVLNLALDSY
jgi:hypothetical protein